MARRPATRVEFTLFDAAYEDGAQRANSRPPNTGATSNVDLAFRRSRDR